MQDRLCLHWAGTEQPYEHINATSYSTIQKALHAQQF